jgi:O-methyltransferase domain/Dimerisation domain
METNVGSPVSQAADVPSPARLSQLITGFRITQAIYVAATLGIADLLAIAPRPVEEVARVTGTHAPSLDRLLLMLASIGLFTQDADGRFRNTALSEHLRDDHPHSMRGLALMYGAPWTWTPWGALDETIKTGRPAFDRLYGRPMFDHLAQNASDAAIYNKAMSSTSARDLPGILDAYDFSGFDCIVDVGGGHGALLQAILARHPGPRGVLADQAPVLANAPLTHGSLARRCTAVPIDFFEAVPADADCYVLKQIVHDWNDQDALRILRNVRSAIGPDGRLLLIDIVLKAGNEPDPGRGLDMHMLVTLKGRERTAAEVEVLLDQAGFAQTRVIPTAGLPSIVESRPA